MAHNNNIFNNNKSNNKNKINVFCFHYSLDVEGQELPVLKTIPWDKVDISVLAVEYLHGKGGKKPYVDYMKSVGYRVHSTIKYKRNEISLSVNDFIFVKNDFVIS